MMTEKSVLAIDLGAESGRVMRVGFDGKTFTQDEVHRFDNTPFEAAGALYWNAPRLWHEISAGIYKARAQNDIASIGLCTWGVDFALLDVHGNLIDNPVHYRDGRTNGMTDWVFERVPERISFERTGIDTMSINTLFQLASLKASNSPALKTAETLLTISALFNYWLSGEKVVEFTHATTTQCYNPRASAWDTETLDALELPANIFPEVVQPGTRLGDYRGIPVIATTTHDTASAVVAVPATVSDYAYISSGTWSIMGLELAQPIINDAAFTAGLTNEGGANGTYRLQQNLMALWLAQQSRATWQKAGRSYSYDELVALAREAEPFRSWIDPNDERFLEPGDMPERIRAFCAETGQPTPENEGQIMRTIFESLAFRYRQVLDELTQLTGSRVEHMHIVGGGSRNALLNQMTANVTNRPVFAGPTEGTALGNAIVQLIALGELRDIAEGRVIVGAMGSTDRYDPQNHSEWDEAYRRIRR